MPWSILADNYNLGSSQIPPPMVGASELSLSLIPLWHTLLILVLNPSVCIHRRLNIMLKFDIISHTIPSLSLSQVPQGLQRVATRSYFNSSAFLGSRLSPGISRRRDKYYKPLTVMLIFQQLFSLVQCKSKDILPNTWWLEEVVIQNNWYVSS